MQTLYLLAWVYQVVINAGELAAFTALELALKDAYFNTYKSKGSRGNINSFFRSGLEYMVKEDGLTDEKLPIFQKSGRIVVANLYGEGKEREQISTLENIRNSLAHGDPFDSFSWASLLEIVRDLIDYMYRNDSKCP